MLTYTFDEISSTPYAKLSVFSYTNILHRHTFFEITLILRGTAASVINSQQAKQLSAGDLILARLEGGGWQRGPESGAPPRGPRLADGNRRAGLCRGAQPLRPRFRRP